MIKPEKKEKIKPKSLEQRIPLIIEVVPGQAKEGILGIYEPGTYEQKELKELVDDLLSKDYAIEDKIVVNEVNKQLNGGKLIYNGKEITTNPLDYAVVEETKAGEKYYYVKLRAIKPQEGGSYHLMER